VHGGIETEDSLLISAGTLADIVGASRIGEET
jgi:hypothetical protein